MPDDTGRAVPAIEAMQETFALHLAAVQGVQNSALTRMREAEEKMRQSIEWAEAAAGSSRIWPPGPPKT